MFNKFVGTKIKFVCRLKKHKFEFVFVLLCFKHDATEVFCHDLGGETEAAYPG